MKMIVSNTTHITIIYRVIQSSKYAKKNKYKFVCVCLYVRKHLITGQYQKY